MADAIASLVDILKSNWNKPPQPSIEDIADLDKGDAKRVRMLDKDVIRIFETAHNEAQPELLYDFVNQHVNLTIDIRSVKTRERLSELRDETRRILHAFRKGDGINFDRIIFKTRTDLSDRSKKLFRYTLQCEVVTFTLDATGDGGAVVNPATGAVTVGQSQAYDTDLTALATLSHSDGAFIVSDGTTWVAESGATARTSLGLGSLATESTIDTTDIADSALITSSESFADSDTAIMTAAAIEDKILSYGYTTETGDITGVTAGTGLSGGGTSGDVTLNVDTSTIATKTYVDTSVTNLVDGAPGVLDTLNELAAALGDDANFANTVLLKSDNLSSLTSASTARTNLGLGDLATQSLANGGDNRIITSTSSSTLNAEATLTYDGAKLEINNGAGEIIGIGGGGTGYQSIEIGGDTGAYIDLKSPNSDDYDLRIISTGSGGTIQTSSPLTFQTGSDNSDITLSPHGTGNVQVNADLVVTGDLSVSGGYGLSASDIPNLAASKITSGTFADALIAASNVTQHQSSLSITESQISDLQSYLTAPRTVTAGGNTLANGETLAFTAGSNVTITEVGGAVTIASTDTNTQLTLLDEDDMSSNSATAAASQQSIKAYVDAEIADLVDSAPGTLDTLGELATALQANDNDITTITTALGNRLRIDVNTQGLTSTQQANGLTNLGITASLAEINILDGGLSASDIPSLATSKITSGTFADARIAESNVTQHQAALSITESQISDLQSYLTAPRTVTAGGNTLASGETLAFTAGSNVTITELNGAVTIASTDTNTNQLTTFTLAGDSGSSQTIGQGDTLKVAGGSAISTVADNTDTVTINHDDTSSQANVSNTGRTYIQSVTLDTYGHVTGLTSATETVTNTDVDVNVSNLTARLPQITSSFTIGDASDVTVTTSGDLIVSGDLTVSGDTVTVNTATLSVEDPLIFLANGQTGTPSVDIGFIGERGTSSNVGIIWDESADTFSAINTTDTATTAGNVTIASYANFRASTFTGSLSGNASTASALASAVNIAGQSFDGSSSITIATTDLSDITALDTDLSSVSGSDDTLASAKAIKSYVDTQIASSGDITSVVAGSGLTGGATSGEATLNIGAGTGIDVAADSISVDVSDFMTNGADNRVLTATGTDAFTAESNFTYDATEELATVDKLKAQIIIEVQNDTASTISKGEAVYVSGEGTHPSVTPARADASSTMPSIGIVTNSISASGSGYVTTNGVLTISSTVIDDTLSDPGDVGKTLYVSPTTAGNLTITKPTTSSHLIQNVGRIVDINGSNVKIAVSNIGRSNDVPNTISIAGSITGSSIIKSGGTSSQFLKADGSVDSTTYSSTTGTVTSIGTTAPITGGTITGTGTIGISAATTSAAGSMSAADKTKLDGIEASADVTDTANVRTALNAAMPSNTLTIGDGSTAVTIPGNLTVTGDTTYSNETIQIVTDNTLAFRAGDGNSHEILLTANDATADRTITLPNAAGTVAVSASGGIALSALGDITANLSDSHIPDLAASKITSGTFGTARIADDAITEAKLKATNSPTDNYLLSYDSGTTGFTWVAAGTGGDINQTITTGTGISGAESGSSDSITIALDFSELTDMTGDISGTTEFILQDGSTESRKAASEIKLSAFNNDSGFTSNTGDITAVVAGTGLSGGATSGSATLNVSGLTVTEFSNAAIQLSSEAFSDSDAVLMTAAAVNDRIESFGYTTNVGDITGVTAGSGLTGGGNSGAVTLSLDDPANLTQLTESTDATDDKILLWDESASSWKYMTLDDLQDSVNVHDGNIIGNEIIGGYGAGDALFRTYNPADHLKLQTYNSSTSGFNTSIEIMDNKEGIKTSNIFRSGHENALYGTNMYPLGNTGSTEANDWNEVFKWEFNQTMSSTTSAQYQNFSFSAEVVGRGIQTVKYQLYGRGEYGVQDTNGWWTTTFTVEGLNDVSSEDVFLLVFNAGTSLSKPNAKLYYKRTENWELRGIKINSMFVSSNLTFTFEDTNVGETTPTNDGNTGSSDKSPNEFFEARFGNGDNTNNKELYRGLATTNVFFDTSTERMGIGNQTPATLLDIKGDAANSGGTYRNHLSIIDTAAYNTANAGGSIILGGVDDSSGGTSWWAKIAGEKANTTDQNQSGILNFYTRKDSSAPVSRMVIDEDGNVGIGTSSPDSPLHINVNDDDELEWIAELRNTPNPQAPTNFGAGIKLALSSGSGNELLKWAGMAAVKSPDLNYSRKVDAAFYTQTDAGNGVAPTEKMRITGDGEVGIGTTSPTPILHVKADNSITDMNSAGAAGITIEQDGTGDAAFSMLLSATRRWMMGIDNSDSDKLKFATGGTSVDSGTALTIDTSGNVGIGTTSPVSELQIAGDTTIYNGSAEAHLILRRNATGTNYGSSIKWQFGDSASSSSGHEYARITGNIQDSTDGSEDGYLTLQTSRDGTLTEAIRINKDGQVGIGTTSPSYLLDVAGNARFGTTGVAGNIYLSADAAGSYIGWNSSGTDVTLAADDDLVLHADDAMLFQAGAATKMTLLSSGNLGIGTTTPSAPLHVKHTGNGDTLILESTDAAGVSDDMAPNLVLTRNGTPAQSTNTDAGRIQFKALDYTSSAIELLGQIQSEFNTADSSARMRFNVSSSGGSGHNDYEYMRFDGGVRDVVFNESGIDIDVRIEGDSDTALFFTDASSDRVGIGTTSPTHKLQVNGDFAATSKSFDIEHPTKEGMRLHHGSLEGPEHGVYVRGRLQGNVIDLPDYWTGLVDDESITVQLTPNKGFQQIYVRDISDNKVHVASHDGKPIDCFYLIQGERKDVERFEVEY